MSLDWWRIGLLAAILAFILSSVALGIALITLLRVIG